ncbi:MAG TPA: hypothetical protein DD979_12400 [Gammaproteobacteria bacterium]|jgi:diguanylate cyclase (GGDEF)-like protein|nr:hypothetical protein [Gammaproteobacteria bacterium]
MTSASAVNSKTLGARRLRQDIMSQQEGRLRERLRRSSRLREKQISALDFLADNLVTIPGSDASEQRLILTQLVDGVSDIFEFSACGIMWVNANRMFELYDVAPQGCENRIHGELARLRETGALVRVLQSNKPALKESSVDGEWLVYHPIRSDDSVLGLMVGVLPDQGMIDGVLLKLFEVILRNTADRLYAEASADAVAETPVFHIEHNDIERYGSRLKFVSDLDRLTGIANRENFLHHLEVLINADDAGPIAVITLDFEAFGCVNDTFGYATGNEILLSATQRLQEQLADEALLSNIVADSHGVHIARVGEDEFGLAIELADNVHDEDLLAVAQILLDELAKTYSLSEGEVTVSGNAGISRFPRDGSESGALLIQTVRARMAARREGVNRGALYTADMAGAGADDNLLRARELSDGLKGSQLDTWFQPRINLHSGKIIGAEALVRWRHPQQGLLLPADFMPLAESSGLVADLGECVLRDACRLIAQADDAGFDEFQVSINLSARQLQDEGLVGNFKAIMDTHNASADRIEFEIAEVCVAENLARVKTVLCELAEIGFRISIDDFGKGATSLAALRSLPVSLLKIDQTFIQGLQKDRANRAIINALVAMGRDLDVKILAEGVESDEQLSDIRELGCDQVQGFFLARPSGPGSFSDLMDEWRSVATAIN